jgi:hypothetical protein
MAHSVFKRFFPSKIFDRFEMLQTINLYYNPVGTIVKVEGKFSLILTSFPLFLMDNTQIGKEIRLIRIDSTTRDVRECIVKAYKDPDELSSITLYGNNYDRGYCEGRIPEGIVVDFDHMNIF